MAVPPSALSRRVLHATHSSVTCQSINTVRHTSLEAQESNLIPLPPLHNGQGSSFLGSALPNNTVKSKFAVGIKPGDSGGATGFQVDEFTHLVGGALYCSITHLPCVHRQCININPIPTSTRLSALLLHDLGVKDTEHGFDSILS